MSRKLVPIAVLVAVFTLILSTTEAQAQRRNNRGFGSRVSSGRVYITRGSSGRSYRNRGYSGRVYRNRGYSGRSYGNYGGYGYGGYGGYGYGSRRGGISIGVGIGPRSYGRVGGIF